MKRGASSIPNRILLAGSLALMSVASPGCFLRLLLGREVVESLREEIDLIRAAFLANATTAVCRRRGFGGLVECTYLIESPDGIVSEETSTAQLVSEFGLVGVVIDPLVLELPAGATGIRGTFTDGGANAGELLVYPGLSYVPIDDNRRFAAGPGKQLVILDFPEGTPLDGFEYQLSLEFQQLVPAGTGPTAIRGVFTGKVPVFGKTFYPPMFPCTGDLASLPAITLPRSAALKPLALPGGLEGCSNELYLYVDFPIACDLDNDRDVDRDDISLIMAMRNREVDPGDPRDRNFDGVVNVNDARQCTLQCTRPRCT